MRTSDAVEWVKNNDSRTRALAAIHQPVTATHLSRRTALDREYCSRALCKFAMRQLVSCLNPSARRSRLYWLTRNGEQCQRALNDRRSGINGRSLPRVDWELYGWTCYSHRTAIVKALGEPLHAAAIKRKAVSQNPKLRLSFNNCRDALYLLLERGVVRRTAHDDEQLARYELSDAGKACRDLLLRAEVYW